MNKFFLYLPGLFLIISCSDKTESLPQNVVPETLAVTAFTATVTCLLDEELTPSELLSGSKGALYIQGTDCSRNDFISWLEGENEFECKISKQVTVNSNGSIDVKIDDLKSETTYSYCLFYKSSNGKKQYLSEIRTFTTNRFTPEILTGGTLRIRYYDVEIEGEINNIASADTKYFTQGIILSLNEDISDETAFKKTESGEFCPNFSVRIDGLSPGQKYFYRVYLKSETKHLLLYGPVKSFISKSLDGMRVNLGLSVEWANCNFGAQEPLETGDYYQWGENLPDKKKGMLSYYDYYDANTHSYLLSEDIMGTDYDIVHSTMQGNWRLPSIDEIVELFENSDISVETDGTNHIVILTSSNGGVIIFPAASFYMDNNFFGEDGSTGSIWNMLIQSGSVDINNNDSYYCYRVYFNPLNKTTNHVVNIIKKHSSVPIRPVWDPELDN